MKIFRSSLFLFLRISVGWHFLYEGVIKIADPKWSAEAYLRGSYGVFAPIFHFLSSGPGILSAVDFMNEWGLAIIGAGHEEELINLIKNKPKIIYAFNVG